MSQQHLRSTTEKLSSARKTANWYSSAKDKSGTKRGAVDKGAINKFIQRFEKGNIISLNTECQWLGFGHDCKKLHHEWRAVTKGRNEELKIFLLHRMFMYLLKRKTCLDYHTAYNPLLSFISGYLLTNFGARSHLFLVLAWKVLLSQIMPNLAKVISSSLS